jgi:hypothetical protein
MGDRLVLQVSRDGHTDRLQLAISKLDENGAGNGYRLAGPKFNGSGKTLLSRTLDEDDAAEIRRYLDAVFPLPVCTRCERTITGVPVVDPDDRSGRKYCSEDCLTSDAEAAFEQSHPSGVAT